MGIRFKNLVIFILINLTFSIRVYANILKDISFEKISINEGLSNEYVTTIFQDSKGYMWIGTKDGLNRYDGQIIKIYNCNADNINTLSSTNINDIEEDVYGNIWVATDDGLDFILTDTDKVVRLKDISKEDNLGRTNITVLLKSEYEENIMWVGTETGLFRIDVKSKEVRYFDDNSNEDNALVDSAITSLVETEENSLWVGSKKGINIIDEDLKVTNVDNINLDEEKTFITHMSKDNKGNLWLSTKKGVFFYNIKENIMKCFYNIGSNGVKEYNFEDNTISDIYELSNTEIKLYNNFIFNDSKGDTWISSSSGAIRYSEDTNEFQIIKRILGAKNTISSNAITCFYEDFNGIIWVGTEKGLNIVNENIIFNGMNEEEINVVSIQQCDNYIWVATKFNGIYIYDYTSKNLLDILCEDDNFRLSDRYVKNLFKISERYIVIVTNKELVFIDLEKRSYEEMLIGDDYYSEMNYIYNDGEEIWIASTTSFYSYNINSGEKNIMIVI